MRKFWEPVFGMVCFRVHAWILFLSLCVDSVIERAVKGL